MPNFSQTSVNELRKMLVDSGTMTQEQADAIKGKQNLVDAVLAIEDGVDNIDIPGNMEVIDTVESLEFEVPSVEIPLDKKEESEDKEFIPTPLDVGWNDYVLSQFGPEELADGKYPTLNGLRRVTEKLIGPIVKSGPRTLFPATECNLPGRASVLYEIIISDPIYGIQTFSAVGGAWTGNTDAEYAVFPECMAENRGESRALRRALRLKTVAVEEITKQDTKEVVRNSLLPTVTDGEWDEFSTISIAQAIFLKKKCKELGIDLNKFINSFDKAYESVESINRKEALKMIEKLNQYQSAGDKNLEVPQELKLSN